MDYSEYLIYLRQHINRFYEATQNKNLTLAKQEAKEISDLAQTIEAITWTWEWKE